MGPEEEFFKVHWQEQFGALVRDKVSALMDGCAASELDPLYHTFEDPSDGDNWSITYTEGEFYLSNYDWDGNAVLLDLQKLGVAR